MSCFTVITFTLLTTLSLSWFYLWGNWGSEMPTDSSKTQLPLCIDSQIFFNLFCRCACCRSPRHIQCLPYSSLNGYSLRPWLAVRHSFTQQTSSQFRLSPGTPTLQFRIQFDSSHRVQILQILPPLKCVPRQPLPSQLSTLGFSPTFRRDCCCNKLLTSLLADLHNFSSPISSTVLPRWFP